MSKVHEIVTDKILNALDNGIIPWRRPWKKIGIRPCNAETGRAYGGANAFILGLNPYTIQAYLTFNQIKKHNLKIKEGQEKKHSMVCYFKMLENTDANGNVTKFPMLRYFLVWNVEQLDGDIPLHATLKAKIQAATNSIHNPIAEANEILNNYVDRGPHIEHKLSDIACYWVAHDKITMPDSSQFTSIEEYYATLYHEMIHSTGAKTRLARKEVMEMDHFGSHAYSSEEFVAELGAAFLCAEVGISNAVIDNQIAYIQTWQNRLKADPKLFFSCASKAQKAVDFILNRTDNNQADQD